MKSNIVKKISVVIVFVMFAIVGKAVNVTLLIDEGVTRPAALAKAEANLAKVLTEINRAQKSHAIVSVKDMSMNEFAKKSLSRLWAVTPFYCDDEEVVERAWIFRDGSMLVRSIPLIITPEGEDFGNDTYQEASIEFDRNGKITDFRFSLGAEAGMSVLECGSVVEKEKQMIIRQYVERFRTAYNMKDIQFIEDVFSDDALIITGHVVAKKTLSDGDKMKFKVEYTRQDKEQYIRNLKRAFARNKWIDVKFSKIGEESEKYSGKDGKEESGCSGITRSKVDPEKYGVRLHQSWKSSNYSDEGYLFLLWKFPEDGSAPTITVRTWQPELVGGKHQDPDASITTLGGFDL